MTAASVLDHRHVLWVERLFDHGYDSSVPPAYPFDPMTTIAIRARRLEAYGAPRVTIDVVEVWLPGDDPELGLESQGCFLLAASWHAQVGSGAIGAERFEVDRFLHADQPMHRHPLGEPNEVRVDEPELLAPEQWIQRVEQGTLEAYDVD